MRKHRIYLLLVLLLPFSLALTLVYREIVRQVILIPILQLVWSVQVFLSAIGQHLLWGVVLLFVALLFLWEIRAAGLPDRDMSGEVAADHGGGRVIFWRRQVRLMHNRRYSKEFSHDEFRRLVLAVLAEQEQASPQQVERRLKSGSLQVPPAVREILEVERTAEASEAGARPFRSWLAKVFSRGRASPDYEFDPALNETMHYLEEQLEAFK